MLEIKLPQPISKHESENQPKSFQLIDKDNSNFCFFHYKINGFKTHKKVFILNYLSLIFFCNHR